MSASDEKIILAGTPVHFEATPIPASDGVVFAQFEHWGKMLFILEFEDRGKTAFVVKTREEFKIRKPGSFSP